MGDTINDILNDELLNSPPDEDKEEKLNLDDDKVEEDKPEEDEDKEEIEDEDESEDKEDEDKDEEDEEKLDLKDEDELDLINIPRRSEIKAKYPNFFKDFPQVDHVIQREKQYSELFPSLTEAKEAKGEIDRLIPFEKDLLNGNLEETLKSVKAADESAFNKLTDHYTETLFKVDKGAHLKLTNTVFTGILKTISDRFKDSEKDSDGEQVLIAARILHKAVYGTAKISGPEAFVSPENKNDPEKDKLQNERRQFEQTKLNDAVVSVTSSVNSRIQRELESKIDTKDVLPPYMKEILVRDILSALDKDMRGDRRFRDFIDRKWVESNKAGYSEESKKAIVKALLQKAGTLLPSIMRSKKAAAMKGLVVRKRDKDEKDESPTREEKRESSGQKPKTFNRQESDRLKPRDGESNRSFLMRD